MVLFAPVFFYLFFVAFHGGGKLLNNRNVLDCLTFQILAVNAGYLHSTIVGRNELMQTINYCLMCVLSS